MKIAITGANGYLGSHVTSYLYKAGYDVTAVDFRFDNLPTGVKRVSVDILEEENVYEKIGSPDVLIHLAWRDGFVHSSQAHMKDLSKHFTFLSDALKSGVKYLSVMGSMHEVGYHEGRIDENTPCLPMSQYGIAKNSLRMALTEMINREYKDVAFHWLRGFYIYGDDGRSNSIFAKLLKATEEGKTEFPLNSGKNQYDFISIDEMAKQIALASVQNEINGIINCCSGKPVALGVMIEEYVKKNNLTISLAYGKFPDRPYDSPVIYGDDTKIRAILDRR